MAQLLFYVLGALSIAGALGVVLSRNAMASVLSLLGSLFALAVIYLLAGFQFLAAAQILVYVGAVLVLFLFVIMLLDLAREPSGGSGGMFASTGARLAAALAVAIGLVLLIATQTTHMRPPAPVPEHGFDALQGIAVQLFGRYGLAFEAISLLLLGTVVAVMLLAKRQRGPRVPSVAPPAPTRHAFGRPVDPRETVPEPAVPAGSEEPRR